VSGLPLSRLSSCANSSARDSIPSAIFQSSRPRSLGSIPRHLDVFGAAARDVRDLALVGGVLDREGLARRRGHPAPADQKVVRLAQKRADGFEDCGSRAGHGMHLSKQGRGQKAALCQPRHCVAQREDFCGDSNRVRTAIQPSPARQGSEFAFSMSIRTARSMGVGCHWSGQ
jgi:hypothetical protein